MRRPVLRCGAGDRPSLILPGRSRGRSANAEFESLVGGAMEGCAQKHRIRQGAAVGVARMSRTEGTYERQRPRHRQPFAPAMATERTTAFRRAAAGIRRSAALNADEDCRK